MAPTLRTKSKSSFKFYVTITLIIIGWICFLLQFWKGDQFQSRVISRSSPRSSNDTNTTPHNIVVEQKRSTSKAANDANVMTSYELHIIFSTDCEPFQDWQSILLLHSAIAVGISSPVTRIASGCNEPKKTYLRDLYRQLFPAYGIHFTPCFKKDNKTGKIYNFYNKPWGLKHWLEHAHPPVQEGIVVALLDPDMIFLRPLSIVMRGQPNILYDRNYYKSPSDIIEKIVEQKPAAQLYGLGAPWTNDNHKKFNRTFVCGPGSPCLNVNERFGAHHYAVGPPYIAHKNDMIRIANSWTKFVTRVYEGYPHLLAEMYAYSMAAAHEKLPHAQFEHFMVSNTEAGGEGWPWIDKLPDSCNRSVIADTNTPLPTLIHFCQDYHVNGYQFFKRNLRKDFFSCDSRMINVSADNFDNPKILRDAMTVQSNMIALKEF